MSNKLPEKEEGDILPIGICPAFLEDRVACLSNTKNLPAGLSLRNRSNRLCLPGNCIAPPTPRQEESTRHILKADEALADNLFLFEIIESTDFSFTSLPLFPAISPKPAELPEKEV